MIPPRFSVIIPVFNQSPLVQKCLESLSAQTFAHFEVILIDNASVDCISEKAIPPSLKVKFFHFSENRYFAEAVNQGFHESSGNWLFVLNSDVTLDPNFLMQAEQCTLENIAVQCTSGVLYSMSGDIDSCGVRPGKTFRPRDLQRLQNETIFGPCGAAFLLRRDLCTRLIKEDGFLLDPKISFFYSDLDLAFRLREKGIRTQLIPNAKGVHTRAGSTPKKKSLLPFASCRLSAESKSLLLENRKAFLKKWRKQKKFWNFPFVWGYDLALRIF